MAWCFPSAISKLVKFLGQRPIHGCGLLLLGLISFAIIWPIWREGNQTMFRDSLALFEMLIFVFGLRISKWAFI